MDLSGLIKHVTRDPAIGALARRAASSKAVSAVALDAAKPCLVAALGRELGRPILVVTARGAGAVAMQEQISLWTSSGDKVYLFPEPDALPYEARGWDPALALDRIRVLDMLANGAGDSAPVVVTSIPAIALKTLTRKRYAELSFDVRAGGRIAQREIIERLLAAGYYSDGPVELPGTFTRRGGIIDVYPPTEDRPVRLDFFGDEVESVRGFDAGTQSSVESLDVVRIGPARESLYDGEAGVGWEDVVDSIDVSAMPAEEAANLRNELKGYGSEVGMEHREAYSQLFLKGSFLECLSKDAVVLLEGGVALESAYTELLEQAQDVRDSRVEKGELPRSMPAAYAEWREMEDLLEGSGTVVRLEGWERAGESGTGILGFAPTPNFGGHLRYFLRDLRGMLEEGSRVAIVSHQAERLAELLAEVDIYTPVLQGIAEPPSSGIPQLVKGSLAEGWTLKTTGKEKPLALFTDKEIFGYVKQRRASRRRPVKKEAFASEIRVGEYVVHIDHGIGRFVGVTTMKRDEGEREYLTIEYADAARLYVPNDSVDRVTPYIGSGEGPPAMNRLGTQEWSRAKRKVKESAEKIARELLSLYAKREMKKGYSYSQDNSWLQEMEASFPYVETPDQMETIRDVKRDMEQPRPMDRLVCGDVGYGKTEVAVRAAFKAVLDGRQVAVLVPTTVLAQQHLQTFRERLKAFPVEIEVLSRFRSAKEQKSVLGRLEEGSVDVCIGTHRLLQEDVEFKDLGLVVIDEEQRFGVAHKEKLKRIREEVDVLTLSATPIPRTLHMSLVGVRDMSTMETPPEERLPIRTYVQEYDDEVVREAILREMDRGGQVFFVHNRVQSIEALAQRLRKLVPESRVAVGHGQMNETQLEKVMVDFAARDYDVLVCTTIIESGLDMPNVNTIIVHQSERMGLSQLYQLRGRVGRGADRAYAYFFFDRYKAISEVAEKRLKAIQAATELGAGFRIAMKDLEIRGAGNLLGVEQSGHIAAVGFDLYCAMLGRAIDELKELGFEGIAANGASHMILPLDTTTAVDIPIPAYLPEDYVPGLEIRLALYQRLARLREPTGVDSIAEEMEDRFGSRPTEVENLLYLLRLKLLASPRGIMRIARDGKQIVLYLGPEARVNGNSSHALGRRVRVGSRQVRVDVDSGVSGWQGILEEVVERVYVPESEGKGRELVGARG